MTTSADRAALARVLARDISLATRQAAETKRAPLALGAVDQAGTFEGYASLFDVADLGRDVVDRGAFSASLRKRGASQVKMLWQHDPAEPIGAWLSIAEDARGLKVRGRLNLAVARAREILSLMREGQVDGLSIGFRTEQAAQDRKTGLRHLQKIDLWEISLVTFPMLPQARVTAVKRAKTKRDVSGDDLAAAFTRIKWQRDGDRLETKFARVAELLDRRYAGQPRTDDGRYAFGGLAEPATSDKPAETAENSVSADASLVQRNEPSEAYCRLVKELCIVEATDTLPTRDFGASFFKFLNNCLERYGCLGLV